MTAREDRRVDRLVATLALWPDTRIKGDLLAQAASIKKDRIPVGDLHRLWPVIEQRLLAAHNLYLIRPMAHLQHGIVASTDEGLVLVQKRKRNQYIGTMMSRDGIDQGVLMRIRDRSLNPRRAVTAAQALAADKAWLTARSSNEVDPLETLIDGAIEDYRKLPWLQLDGSGLHKVLVGPNGLPLTNGHHK